jgi:hypothetical protein
MIVTDPTLIGRRLRRLSVATGLPLATLQALHVHDGLLRRLAVSSAGRVFAVHGRTLARRWGTPRAEPAVHLVAACPFDEALPALQALLAAPVADGVQTDPHVLTLEPLGRADGQPAGRATVVARFGATAEATLDLLFTAAVIERAPYPALIGSIDDVPQRTPLDELAARVYALADPKRFHWAPDDLHEVWRMASLEWDEGVVGEAITATFAAHGTALTALDRLRTGTFGASSSSRRDWRKLAVVAELPTVATEVGAALRRWL